MSSTPWEDQTVVEVALPIPMQPPPTLWAALGDRGWFPPEWPDSLGLHSSLMLTTERRSNALGKTFIQKLEAPERARLLCIWRGGCNREANMFHRNPTFYYPLPHPHPWLRAQPVFRESLVAWASIFNFFQSTWQRAWPQHLPHPFSWNSGLLDGIYRI